ncbi:MlaD family protein [Mycolicibacterium sp. lyk4-40-TYG-92]|uniref:MCE family protein n=1 Tax=Mycolicibacterium sp. lyk4-40-TYG-92 TaxID=3040295 RepID=UPI00254C0BCA|nr:MlaD family protein [Mycolicibacterium sp. lyk4-40-TYG-92]
MHLDRRIKIQLVICAVIALAAGAIMIFGYIRLPATLFGIGRYTVTVELPSTGGLYAGGNVTYRGAEVGLVKDVHLTDAGVAATLALRSGVAIPSDLDAQVHSVSALGEQYIALTPRNATSAPLRNGDVIPLSRVSVPPDINSLIAATNRGLQAIPRDNLKTVVDESYTAVSGLGPEIARLIKGSTTLAVDARQNLDPLTTLIDQAQPVLDSQADTSDAVRAWAAHLATIAGEVKTHDTSVAGLLEHGSQAAGEVRQLFERLQLTLPILLANLVTVGQVAVAYQPNIEQILVLVPQIVQEEQGTLVPSHNTKQSYKGAQLDFNLNLNVPPPCKTGFLPPQQQRSPVFEDYPDVPPGALYCRVPQDSQLVAVRGARNIPCATVAGKRAPTFQMCESGEEYVPLNDGTNWKGDPNATLSGQSVPQLPPPPNSAPTPARSPVSVAKYDPTTGAYVGPDGKVYTQANLSNTAQRPTWQSMLVPPNG